MFPEQGWGKDVFCSKRRIGENGSIFRRSKKREVLAAVILKGTFADVFRKTGTVVLLSAET